MRRAVVPAALAMLLFLAASASAVNLSNSPNWQSWYPRITADTLGNLHVLWLEVYSSGSGDIFYSKFTKSVGTWSAPQNISNSGRVFSATLMLCSIASDSSNRVYAFWSEGNIVRLRTQTGGSWGAVDQVAQGSGLDGARVAVSTSGDVFMIWWTGDGTIFTRARIGGSWEGAANIGTGGRRSKFPDIAVGNSMVMGCWNEKNGNNYQAVYVRRGRGAGAGWSSPAVIFPQTYSQQHPVVEFANGDTPHIVMTPVIDPDRIVHHCPWTGSGFGTGSDISDQTMLHYPSLATKSGKLCATWQTGSYGAGQAIYFNIYENGRWGGQTAVPGSNGCTFSDVAFDSDGKPAIVYDASGEIYFSVGTEGGGGGKPVNLPPVPDFIFSPATGLAPLIVTFDAGGSYDPDGSIAQYSWLFGDGTTGSGQRLDHLFERKGSYAVKLTAVDNAGASASKIKPIEILGLLPPLNVHWQTSTDESLFMTRSITDVSWAANPANDAIAPVAKYRVYRKNSQDDDAVYKLYAEVTAATFTYRDTKVSAPDIFVYAVTALDAAGHESPLSGNSSSIADEWDARMMQRMRRILEAGTRGNAETASDPKAKQKR